MTKLYGVDVAKQRADDLDKLSIEAVGENEGCSVLELGCAKGGQTRRLIETGAKVTAVDIVDYSDEFKFLSNVTFIHEDIRKLEEVVAGQTFDFCVFQRTIHYLKYSEALDLLTFLKKIVSKKLFISVTGIDSDIGEQYTAKELLLAERFSTLEKEAQETFSITEPVCLYTPVEFIELLTEAGFEIEVCWVSAFGNIKAICK